jgi:hypothetical protein
MDEAPLRIECYDVSHLSGTNVVASMVVFEDGLPRKDQYRSFSIAETTDDTDSLYQVLTRRLAHVDRDEAAAAAAETAGRSIPPMASRRWSPSANDRGSHTVRSCWSSTAVRHRSRLPHAPSRMPGTPRSHCAASPSAGGDLAAGEDFPVILPRTSEALYLIQRLRDEAHRFAITHQRKRRKRDISTVLGEVPGLGDARIKALLRHFGSVAALSSVRGRDDGAARNRPQTRGRDRAAPRKSLGCGHPHRLSNTQGEHVTDEQRRRGAHRHRDVGSGAHHGSQRPRGPGVVRRRQSAAADARASPRTHRDGRGALPKLAAVVDVRGRDLFQALPRSPMRCGRDASCACCSSTPETMCSCDGSSL